MNESHSTWQYLFRFVDERAGVLGCKAHRAGLKELGLTQREPDPDRLTKILHQKTGWSTRPCRGELPSKEFFESLSRKEFPLGVNLRRLVEVFGSKDPDYWHEAYGHLPTLLNPDYAALYHWFGRAHTTALSRGNLSKAEEIERLYWFSLEYGFVVENGEAKILGAGLIASPLGIERYRRKQVRVSRFKTGKVLGQLFDPHRFRPDLFAIDNLKNFLNELAETYQTLDVGHPLH